jgi:hypothetical protein
MAQPGALQQPAAPDSIRPPALDDPDTISISIRWRRSPPHCFWLEVNGKPLGEYDPLQEWPRAELDLARPPAAQHRQNVRRRLREGRPRDPELAAVGGPKMHMHGCQREFTVIGGFQTPHSGCWSAWPALPITTAYLHEPDAYVAAEDARRLTCRSNLLHLADRRTG